MKDLTIDEAILTRLVHCQEYYKELTKPLRDQRTKLLSTEDSCFQDEINKQYKTEVVRKMGDDLTNLLAIPLEDVIIILEQLDVEEYLK